MISLFCIPLLYSFQLDAGTEIKPNASGGADGYYIIKNTTYLSEIVVDDRAYFYNSTYANLIWNFDDDSVIGHGTNSSMPSTEDVVNISVVISPKFNLTEGENAKLYDASNNLIDANVPIWISSNDRSEVHINSNVSQDMNVTIKFEVDSCDLISNIVYVSDTGKYSKFYADGDYTCEDNYVTIDINGIEPATGSNIIYINSQWLISYRYRPGGIINRNSHNSFNLAALLPYIAGAALLISIVLAAVII